MRRMTWQALSAGPSYNLPGSTKFLTERHDLPGPTAADSVHVGEVIRPVLITCLCRAPVPVRRRRVVRRRQARPLIEATPECIHRFRQPSLGALAVAAQVEIESKT